MNTLTQRARRAPAVTAGFVLLAGIATFTSPAAQALGPAGAEEGFADLIERVQPSVVTVEVNKTIEPRLSGFEGDPRLQPFFERFFGQRGLPEPAPRQAMGAGSGFIIDEAGYIVTNNHVVEGADAVTVRLSDDREFEATVVGTDDKTDLALLKIDADELVATELGDSDTSRVGDWVVAIGNPFGLGGTATVGIVSARGRDIRSGPYDDYLQIDAPINRGNSGGPVFNTDGEVVGVNTAIFSPNGGSVGIGFAIPANLVTGVVEELRVAGTIDRGWLGVQLQNLDAALAESLSLDEATGALVADVVADSPAQRSGVEVGDVIVGYGTEEVADARQLARYVGSADSGDRVKLRIVRDGEEMNLKVTLGDAESQVAAADSDKRLKGLGLTLTPLTDALRERLGLDADVSGAVVARIDPNGLAAEQGLRRGDVLVQADRQPVESPGDLAKTLASAKKAGRSSVPVLVRRGGAQQFASLPVG